MEYQRKHIALTKKTNYTKFEFLISFSRFHESFAERTKQAAVLSESKIINKLKDSVAVNELISQGDYEDCDRVFKLA